MRARSALLSVLVVAAVACSDGSSDTGDPGSSAAVATPGGVNYYRSPGTQPDGEPGELISTEPISLDGVDGTGYRITYVSTTPAGDAVHLTGVAIVPSTEPDTATVGTLPVAVWAHPTVGIGTRCAPSLNEPFSLDGLQQLLDAGYVVMAPDYDGLGSDGVHPYLVVESEGRAVLDIARVAVEFGGSDVVVAWGHSQGGHAALAARSIVADYAPELDLRAVAAASPPTDLALFLDPGFTSAVPLAITAQTVVSWATVYENTGFEQFGTPEALAAASDALESCVVDIAALVVEVEPGDVWARGPEEVPLWATLTAANSIDPAAGASPVYLAHGGADELVPVGGSESLASEFCAGGVDVVYRSDPAWTHGTAYSEPLTELLTWLVETSDGASMDTTC
jgi:acetyl esterase/lipase